MSRGTTLCAAIALLGFAASASAQVQTSYHGCVGANGEPVAALADPLLERVVETRVEGGREVIRYNESVLPRLRSETRLFLFAQECARHNLGLPFGEAADPEQAQRADCEGLATLRRSGLIAAGGVDALARDLQFSPDEWTRLPGPVRMFRLEACPDGGAERHALDKPSAGQPDWNACVRGCGERRRECGPTSAACDEAYDRCVSLCDFRSPP